MSVPLATIGQYHTIELIGEGAMGRVYKAFDPIGYRNVAIKIIRPEKLIDADEAQRRTLLIRFERESRLLATMLPHPHIVRIIDSGSAENGAPYYVMEYLEGQTLDDCAEAGIARLCDLFDQIADAVDYAHNMGVIHRDLKPTNIIVTREAGKEAVKLTDFGIAMVAESSLTQGSFRLIGTLNYMAPEQVTESLERVDHRADLWAIAVTAYKLFGGSLPFTSDTQFELMQRILHSDPEPPANMGTIRSANWENVFGRGLAKAPERRYQSAREFALALRREFAPDTVVPDTHLSIPTMNLARTIRQPPPTMQTPSATPTGGKRAQWSRAMLMTAPVAAIALSWLGVGILRDRAPQSGVDTPAAARSADSTSHRVMVRSTPPGAEIILDGTATGTRTPSETLLPGADAPATRHRLAVRLPCYEVASIDIDATQLEVTLALVPAKAWTTIETDPTGALIEIDGRAGGTSPAPVELDCGLTHTIVARKTGFVPSRRVLEPGSIAPLTKILLSPAAAASIAGSVLQIISPHPYTVRIYQGGSPVFEGRPPATIALQPGPVTISYESTECGYANEWTLTVADRQTIPISLPAPGTIASISCNPPGGAITIDGKLYGPTVDRMCIGPGRHVIAATWSDGNRSQQAVMVHPNGVTAPIVLSR